VHANSRRGKAVFFAVDCGTLSNNLLENELFGHSKGAFTDARDDKPGIFKQADGGTIFLDEISNISLEVQGKLLRFLESREFLPLGAVTSVPVNIRLIFATNRNLQEMVAAGLFREDFYYRIDVYPILLPPLKERKMDILPIAYHFLNQFNRKMDKPITGFEPAAITRLTEYDWPGNVRQLRNAIERAVILCETDQIAVKDLPLSGYMDDIGPLLENIPATNEELKQVKKQIRQKAVRGIEKNFILNALEKNNWNVTRSAKSVGLQRSNFHHMMKKYGISQQPRKPFPE
jgi:DNA-binding NtrC family response regulator